MRAALQQDNPVYIRMGKKGEPKIHSEIPADFRIGKALTIEEGSDVCLLSSGNMLPEVIETARLLKAQGVSARVVSYHTVKPLDEECLAEAFSRFKLVATIEEHSLIGGLGSAVSEWIIDGEVKTQKFLRFGTPDSFFRLSGEQEYAREQLGLSADHMAKAIMAALA